MQAYQGAGKPGFELCAKKKYQTNSATNAIPTEMSMLTSSTDRVGRRARSPLRLFSHAERLLSGGAPVTRRWMSFSRTRNWANTSIESGQTTRTTTQG